MSELDITRHRWITEAQLGTVQFLWRRGARIGYRLPREMGDAVTLRFKGRGKTKRDETGDLMLRISVDRGEDVSRGLWLSAADAHAGCQKKIGWAGGFGWRRKRPRLIIPGKSIDGSVLRVRGLGQRSDYRWGMRLFNRPRGNLLVRLRVFPDTVTPAYRSADALTTENLSLEGWVYRQRDEILKIMPKHRFSRPPPSAAAVADAFNSGGWRAIARLLLAHLALSRFSIKFEVVADLKVPGQCQKNIASSQWRGQRVTGYVIKIRSEFIHDPFTVAAILAHELCHVIESRYLAESETAPQLAGKELMEMERKVDLLVFLHRLGEFQLRVARQSHQTFGYFNQELFDRMFVILQRKSQAG